MPSLYDKLKSAKPIRPEAMPRPEAGECLTRLERVSLSGLEARQVSAQALSFLSSGKVISDFAPEEYLFIDTETTGLSGGAGTLAFLIGVGRMEGNELVITQVLMRDYPQESMLMRRFIQMLRGVRCLVTYNGASFDLPLLEGRMTINRMGEDFSGFQHIDLLHAARRIFKLRLGRCSLTRMEEEVFGEKRTDDLPGSEVPRRYFDYLNSRDEGLLKDVLDHNRQDIASLARLFFRMARMHEQPLDIPHQEDLFSMGRSYERQGHIERAGDCYRACTGRGIREMARMRLAEMYRRKRMDEKAAEEFEHLRATPSASGRVFISLAKIYEHRFHQPLRALEIARQGMVYCSERQAFDSTAEGEYLDLEHRCQRLMRKVEQARNDNQGQITNQKRAAQAPERPER